MENDVFAILRECGFGFKKKLGQNFITDKNLLSSIVRGAGVEEGATAIEIGCGAGTLTRELSKAVGKSGRVVAFEVDKSLKPVLERTLADCPNAEVIFSDFLSVDLKELERRAGEYSVVANLPYYVTTPVIAKLAEEGEKWKSLTVMVQEEVALRLCARENTPEYGAITAQLALYARAEIIKKVPRELFYPRPNVDSAVVKLTAERGRLCVESAEYYKKVVRAAFAARRKTLENNLVNNFPLSREKAAEVLSDCGVCPKARGETLSPEDFARLSNALYGLLG